MKVRITKNYSLPISEYEMKLFREGEVVDISWKTALLLESKGVAKREGWYYQERYQG